MIGTAAPVRRVRVVVEGTVQGVGFRPHVHRLAGELALAGWVCNDVRGVVAEVEGDPLAVDAFLRRVADDAPPMAAVERVRAQDAAVTGESGFAIAASDAGGAADALVAADAATCDACLRELADPADRRFRYPFVNCTNCGPRYTIVRGVPYDRPLTTMAGFAMCAACRAEYDDPADRRFHAQPNACPACGPRARLLDAGGRELPGTGDAVAGAAAALRGGAIVAVKGLGGYHLACLAADARAVRALRDRKHREDRPFALLAADLGAARALVDLSPAAEALLRTPERPIVLAPRRAGAAAADAVAPGHPELGVMLPYTPLHHLLSADVGAPLVLTSGNVSDEPIAYRDEDALERLGGIADRFLVHDRPIHTRVDDSVARPGMMLRRSRGHVPRAIALPVPAPSHLLACGAELKSTFCLARGSRAWLSHHIGDLKNARDPASYVEGVELLQRLFAVEPEVVVHDLHPDFLSTRYALAQDGLRSVAVQHHHAHLAACLAEHGETGPAVGAIFDGAGLGPDGTVWGGELLVGDLRACRRVGHLCPVRLPGGDRAVAQPWRMACAWLTEALGESPPTARRSGRAGRRERVARRGGDGPDRHRLAGHHKRRPPVRRGGRAVRAARRGHVRGAGRDRARGGLRPGRARRVRAAVRRRRAGRAAGRSRPPLARSRAACPPAWSRPGSTTGSPTPPPAACAVAAGQAGVGTVVLSGGVFQNRRLLGRTAAGLRAAGLRVLVPERLPLNDGGIAYGQAAIAAAQEAAA